MAARSRGGARPRGARVGSLAALLIAVCAAPSAAFAAGPPPAGPPPAGPPPTEPPTDPAEPAGDPPEPAPEPAPPKPPRPAESTLAKSEAAFARGDTAAGCEHAKAAHAAAPSGHSVLARARCDEALGRTASAWARYRAASGRLAIGAPVVSQEAVQRAVELEPRLSKLTVSLAGATAGVEVTRDGEVITPASLGVAIAVDPGKHVLEARAPGHLPWRHTITIGAHADKQTVAVPALQPVAVKTQARDTFGPLRMAGVGTTAAGAVGVVIGAVFGALAASDVNEAEADPALCGQSRRCTPAGLALIDQADTKATVSTVGFAVGAPLLAGGLSMLVVGLASAPPEGDRTALQVQPWAEVPLTGASEQAAGGLSIGGRF